jgi:hypothetical protein
VNAKKRCAQHVDNIDAKESALDVKVIAVCLGRLLAVLVQTLQDNIRGSSTRLSVYVRTACVIVERMHATPGANLRLEVFCYIRLMRRGRCC